MTAQSRYPWRFFGTVTDPITSTPVSLDFKIDVPSGTAWQRPEPSAARIVAACTGAVTMVLNMNGVLPKRQARPTLRIPNTPDRATVLGYVRTLWRLKGPWSLTIPDLPGTETITCFVDPSQGAMQETPQGWATLVTLGLAEV